MEVKMLSAAPHRKHSGVRGIKHTAAYSCHSLPDSNTQLIVSRDMPEDSDTDLSESEKLPVSRTCQVPPQLELRSEVIEDEEYFSHNHRVRGRGRDGFLFPDFLPPPFNSWSLSQLAVFYNIEGREAPRPRPNGPLEKYLEKLLQLEWHQLLTIQEERGKLQVSDVISSCHRSAAAASTRLSSPKCILQCQRAFPLTFLSPLASHSTVLPSCAYASCTIHYSTCREACRESRLSPPQHSRVTMSVPKRSYSESRVHSSDRILGPQRFGSPSRTSSYLRRMQASGNIRNPVQGAAGRSHSTARKSRDRTEEGHMLDRRAAEFRRRSGSEQRTSGTKRQQNRSENRQSSSESRKGRAERRRAADCKNKQIKPDAAPATINKFPRTKCSQLTGPSRPKAVDFVL
ncbi:uncharacterized protein LOC108246088 [Kryptolebias marmoratus]|uniref:Family with sequence similarity 217 member Bb n=1 Tax=Kryptolebias marmoratus TaxID=37003 RepID=A0A3Q3B1W9_KRYMA|nr:uncharacterized protein LOC108246088 [Kryptolebias marmoratus]XP_017288935.1 uncharacterized protein LOC108246088 [Kryptolebias marmoratus]